MEIIIFIVPFITAFILLLFYRKETVWWEYLVLLLPSILLYFFTKAIIVEMSSSATEYLGTYAVKVSHYDKWDEWIKRTCSRQVYIGRDSKGNARYRTEYYDCSYRDVHPEYWEMTDKDGNSFTISKDEYNKVAKLWNTEERFKDMHRDYYIIDGDMQYYEWGGEKTTMRSITYPHTYKNKVKASKSIFNFRNVSKEEAVALALFDYPKVGRYYSQNPIIGCKNATDKEINSFKYLNGYYGEKYQITSFVLCFYNRDISVSEEQRNYWVGGNKNEFVICIGLDSLSNKIQWSNCFSWMDEPKLEVATEQFLANEDTLDLMSLSSFLEKKIPTDWKRKEFEDFDYINIQLSTGQYIGILILILLYNIGISIFIIRNDFKN